MPEFNRRAFGLLLLIFHLVMVGRQCVAQQNQAPPDEGQTVYLPDEKAQEQRESQLSTIVSVTDGDRRPPNVLLILADDLGYADIGVHGSRTIPTPHIDSIANGGVRFTNAYVTAASCSPSRAGLLTGRYQQRYGFEFNTAGAAITHRLYRGLDPSAVTLAAVLRKAGYKTGMFGKWHLGTRAHLHPLSRGFDQFFGFLAGAHSFFPAKEEQPIHSTVMRGRTPLTEPEYLTDAIARETVQFINANRDVPFFAYVPFNAVHTPIEATEKYRRRFADTKDPTQRDYNAMTSALDDAVGAILSAVSENDLSKNTLVIFLNDNGGPTYTGVQSNHPLRLGKLFLFEGGIRVPMLAQMPGAIEAGTVFEHPVSSLDIFPSVCAAAGIDLPESFSLDGVDLRPFIEGQNTDAPHDKLFWRNGPNRAMRMGNWKLIQSGKHVWLFDLESDIGETMDLSESRGEIVTQMQSELDNWESQLPQPAWPSKPRRRKVPVDGGIYELNI